jgi:hypothetical protein
MTYYTRRQLCEDVLRRMVHIPPEQDVSSRDLAYMERVYGTKLEQWRDRGLVYWSNTSSTAEEIPAAVYPMLIALLENWVAPTYGEATVPTAEMVAREEVLLRDLRRHVARKPSGLPLSTDYI